MDPRLGATGVWTGVWTGVGTGEGTCGEASVMGGNSSGVIGLTFARVVSAEWSRLNQFHGLALDQMLLREASAGGSMASERLATGAVWKIIAGALSAGAGSLTSLGAASAVGMAGAGTGSSGGVVTGGGVKSRAGWAAGG